MANQDSNSIHPTDPNRTRNGQFRKGVPGVNFGRKHSPEHIEKNRSLRTGVKQSAETIQKRIKWGKDHPNWKGDEVGYSALHIWLKRNLGKPSKCENPTCQFLNPRRYEWANISGEYTRDRANWMQLCPSCHRRYDNGSLVIV